MAKNEKLYEFKEELSKIRRVVIEILQHERRGEMWVKLQSGNGLTNESKMKHMERSDSKSDRIRYIILGINGNIRIKVKT